MIDNEKSALLSLVGYHLRRASVFDLNGAVETLAQVDARPIGLSVLLCMVETPGLTSAEICRILGMQRANIVQFLADLEAKGLFTREAEATDQRVQRLFPTQAGKDAAADWLRRLNEHEDRMLERLNADERAELRRLLGKIWMNAPRR
ncbi:MULTISPECIES: MarR family winged helix-turn-helix transcriptional regulator [Rhizobium]|uniref:Transcriptional regulatory protein n=1 Tax=Rhizobium favelukesii TaxID=348824 RepID=W6R8K0_9HYPH|nr:MULTISPECIES: MarR family transcriptional regulator [Rhizobium]MCA0801720.1 winged helix DNA-binding protein [Rhizobium sp. T1473]MCS0462189.1 winged helix DNA-binding protein [Rhizobium favelukesii]UFS80896.1 winged helix DNA-binding protein [Rhizobium sp. T136]CDM57577.1 putative transcriptional regulatory protein [Rhizobium favelukesii]